MDEYIRETAALAGRRAAKLSDLNEKGTISDEEFEKMKAKVVA